ncbi:MAG: cache domain-containing protein [Azonexus sp.]|nr:cache domain-containing protein [Betaproteobacteria bacterium]MBK8919042.1 cache domain-containing protein [Betaproteobacteria bacterium]MBP6036711.1 cache domain-containing protein [Azonexus sp.]MBP6905494.1 cache domain-containing protein [Azonexus sp.]
MVGRQILRAAIFAVMAIGLYPAQAQQEGAQGTAGIREMPTTDAQRARALLARAVGHFRQHGDEAFAAFNHPGDFVDAELYVYVVGTDGTFLASGGSSAALIGRKVTNMRDAFGTPFFYDMLEKAKAADTGSVEYRWLNRLHQKPERKITFFHKVGTRILAVGYYIPRASPEQANALLDRAVAAVKADPGKAIAAFNDLNGGYIEDDLYVFVVDLRDGRFKAHGVSPRLIDSDGLALTDPGGKPIIRQMIEALKDSDRGELDYAWRNPVTRKVEDKHTRFRKVGDLLVAVGYYTR